MTPKSKDPLKKERSGKYSSLLLTGVLRAPVIRKLVLGFTQEPEIEKLPEYNARIRVGMMRSEEGDRPWMRTRTVRATSLS